MKKTSESKGFGIIEIIFAVTIISLAIFGLMQVGNFALRLQSHLKQNLIAENLAIEAMEATKAFKGGDWTSFSGLSLGTPYYPVKSGSPLKWSLTAGSETINNFSRQVVLDQVSRDIDDNIVTSGGAIDTGTKKVTTTVSWTEQGKSYQVVLTSYLTNWQS